METGTLEKKIAKLPDSLKLKVEGYVDALLYEEAEMFLSAQVEIKKGFGGGKGLIDYMADDFNKPLEDFKDYM